MANDVVSEFLDLIKFVLDDNAILLVRQLEPNLIALKQSPLKWNV